MWLNLLRAACAGIAALSLGKALDLATDSGGHEPLIYAAFGGIGLLSLAMVVWLSFIQRHRSKAPAPTRPIRLSDLLRWSVPQHHPETGTQTAQRSARHVNSELEANRIKVDGAIKNGFWWNVMLEGLQSTEWQRSRDSIASTAPKVYDVVAATYVLIGEMNSQANNHHQGGLDEFSKETEAQLRSLRSRISTSQRALRDFFN
jgi:hypothetical protein